MQITSVPRDLRARQHRERLLHQHLHRIFRGGVGTIDMHSSWYEVLVHEVLRWQSSG